MQLISTAASPPPNPTGILAILTKVIPVEREENDALCKVHATADGIARTPVSAVFMSYVKAGGDRDMLRV